MRRMLGVALGLMLAATGACATAPSASPAPATTVGPSTPAPRPSAITLPPRPRDIPIDDIEPCSLLTEQQQQDLGLNGNMRSTTNATQLFGPARLCTMIGFEPRAIALAITLVTSTGIERFTGGELAGELTPISVQGFPAVIARPTRLDEACSVEIDIAQGQLIEVQFATGGRKPAIPQEQLCRDAEQVAGEVLTTLHQP